MVLVKQQVVFAAECNVNDMQAERLKLSRLNVREADFLLWEATSELASIGQSRHKDAGTLCAIYIFFSAGSDSEAVV